LTHGSNCHADMYSVAQKADVTPRGKAAIGLSQK
jgi:hypothetical protein